MYIFIKASGPARTRHWMGGGRYETDSTSTCVKEIFYLGGTPYSAPMAKVRENGGEWTVYNIGRDYQGSITHLATSDSSLVAEYSYDPWLGRFLSPDPYVQAPDFTQSLNRYSYCLNNPLKYSDESGEILVYDSFLVGFVSGWIKDGFWNGFKEGGKRAWNDIKITAGYFAYDSNKSFGRNVKAFFSRLGKESLQTIAGWFSAQFINVFNIGGGFTSIEYKYGATVLQMGKTDFGAYTLGSFITGDKDIEASPSNDLFQHEYGHYLQSQELGFSYLFKVAIPSIISAQKHTYDEHNAFYTEQDANARAFMYFCKYVDNFYTYDSSSGTYTKNWNFEKNNIIDFNFDLPLSNNNNITALSKALFTDEEPDYFPPRFMRRSINNNHVSCNSKRFMLSRNY